ncbi:hypothetical protein CHU_0768 [Sporocytophaga myxococcoides]|uniref:Secretion system C-terminal sorting domain-containing protein n=1 Tax=Sporocytophaga myxococcoides TaxID=153721 RepID=A0A098LBX9_9BACT|nr:T9SS type A sorting domain-containing protein [Sporocytophaga myxococcoides]GAL83924.1 hypothetical protein CHU_0768 [Sporocytophaga myxococcoides]
MFLKHFKAFGGVLCCLFISSTIYAQNYPAILDVNSLNGANGFAVPALNTGDRIGSDLDFIGDLNGDGFDDIAIGSQEQNNTGFKLGGTAYIIFGSNKPFASTFDLSSLDGTNGFIVQGIAVDERRGRVVKGLGDVNNDGIDDIVIGSEGSKHIILYGKKSRFPASIIAIDINGTNGFIIDQSGINEITGAGDVNGDGISDIILGQAHWSGQTWVIFGKNGNFPATVTSTYVDGINGFKVSAANNTSRPSYHVGSAGDINNDGYDDIIIGNWANSITEDAKLTHVVFGRPAPFPALININTLDGTNGFAIENYGSGFLKWVGKVGDVNGDGIDDFFSDNSVIMGSSKPFPAVLTRANTLNGVNGFELPGTYSPFAPAGDLNLDGINDIITFGPNGEGVVIFGRKNGFDALFNFADLDGTKGFRIKEVSISNIGRPLGGGQDFNGDGKADIVIGSENTQSKGVVYVVFGGDHNVLPLEASYPKVSQLAYEGFNLEVKAKEKGTIYYAIYAGTPNTITKQSVIRSGQNSTQASSIPVDKVNTVITKTITGLAMGTSYTIYLYQEDEKGNIGSIYKLENVKTLTDSEGPTFLACPSDQITGESVLPNFLELVEVVDNRDDNPSVSQTPAAGKKVIDGMTITITAVDDLNNYSTCTFKVFSVPTSIGNPLDAGVKVYPNPVKNIIYLDGDVNYQYKIVNAVGQNCIEGVSNSAINVESLNAGFYTIQFYTPNGQLRHQQKLIKE